MISATSKEADSKEHRPPRRRTLTRMSVRSMSTVVVFFGSTLWILLMYSSLTRMALSDLTGRRMLENTGMPIPHTKPSIGMQSLAGHQQHRQNATVTLQPPPPTKIAEALDKVVSASEKIKIAFSNVNNTLAESLDNLKIPQWMKGYFEWHRQQIQDLNESNWNEKKYLILGCRKGDKGQCGGLADRVKPLPLFLAVANRTNRIFMIRWSKPHRLEEFMNPHYMNWSVPEWMEEKIVVYSNNTDIEAAHSNKMYQSTKGSKNIAKKIRDFRNVVFWEAKAQDIYGGCAVFHQVVSNNINTTQWQNKTEWDPMYGWEQYQTWYGDLFRALFVPSMPVQKLVDKKMDMAHLIPGKYTIAHYRAFYAIEDKKETRTEKQLKQFAFHAVDCASKVNPGVPVYFASDSKVAVDAVREVFGTKRTSGMTVVTFSDNNAEEEALHLDKETDWDTQPSDYYATFVDLLLMANGRCVTYGQGGFGLFAALLSHDATCTAMHSGKKKLFDCNSTGN